jgi:F0F1-type ATP synthase epsilon subunit
MIGLVEVGVVDPVEEGNEVVVVGAVEGGIVGVVETGVVVVVETGVFVTTEGTAAVEV